MLAFFVGRYNFCHDWNQYVRTPLSGGRPSNLTNQPSLRSASWRLLNTHRAQVETCHEIIDFGLGLQPAPTWASLRVKFLCREINFAHCYF